MGLRLTLRDRPRRAGPWPSPSCLNVRGRTVTLAISLVPLADPLRCELN